MNSNTKEAYNLLHNGILALSEMEKQGLRIDVEEIENKKLNIDKQIQKLERKIIGSQFYADWESSVKGKKINIYSGDQLGKYLYGHKKLKAGKQTTTGKGSTDEEALSELNIPELNYLLQIKKLQKVKKTYLDAFLREAVDGYIHPFFNLHLVRTYRGCVSKGTKILLANKTEHFPNGVKIENVKVGDYVYCFDNDLNPVIRKVLWSGKTGTKNVIRVHWATKNRRGYLDLTPEHKIRLANGKYISAIKLINADFRKKCESKNTPKIKVLSGFKTGEYLNFTGHSNINNTNHGIFEHRLVYEQFKKPIKNKNVIHHIDGNHKNNLPENLMQMSLKKHSKFHCENVSNEIKAIRIKTLNENRHKIVYKKGFENANSLKLTKFSCLKLLALSKGKLTKTNHDFSTIKNYCIKYNIEIKTFQKRYATNGAYIWKGIIKKNFKVGRSKMRNLVGGCGYYTMIELYDYFGFSTKRLWKNQFGKFIPHNHSITKIELLNKVVDVYDLQVEEYHNFIANEICVHNSSDSPNFQNIPKRDEEAMQLCRSVIYPRPGHQLVELDYKQLEVRISACYNNDTKLIEDILHGDMHRDMCVEIFKLKKFNKEDHSHTVLRNATKNGFVFPQFYGDYYVNCAVNIANGWGKLPKNGRWKSGQGIEFENTFLADHMISIGIKSMENFQEHLKAIEYSFWNERYSKYSRWKESWWNKYQKTGYVYTKTGFTFQGVMSKNDVINYPIQGCLTKDSKVLTDKGWIEIKYLINKIVNVWTGFEWSEAIGLNMGSSRLAKIELSSGLTINCDIRHKLKNELNQWVEFSKLKVGDYVALPKINKIIKPSENMNWFFIYGFILGDGCLYHRIDYNTERKGVTITVGKLKQNIILKIKKYIENFGINVSYRIIPKTKNHEEKYLINIENKYFAKKLEKVGFIFGSTAHTKCIPYKIWTASVLNQRNFMEGLWLSDGSRGKYDYLSLHLCNLNLLQEVQILTSNLGFDSFLAKTKTGYKLTFTIKKFNKKPKRKMPINTIKNAIGKIPLNFIFKNKTNDEITEKRCVKLNKNISQYVAERILYKVDSNFEVYRYDTIKSITIYNNIEETFTMSVNNERHQFVADGIITKNSAFHCLLFSLIEGVKAQKIEHWKSKIVGQIHDSIIIDVFPDELEHVINVMKCIMINDIKQNWSWLKVPLDVDVEAAPIDAPWSKKSSLKL